MKNKSIILIIVIILVLILSITGVTIYFTTKSILQKDETNITSEDDTIDHGIQDNPDEDDITNIISTPDENDDNSLKNMQATP